ncbi:MAG: HD domain-containing phosphohydrolase, partial [Myxococcota bacterium]
FELRNLSIRRGTLNEEEWAEMRAHPAYSRDFLEKIPWSKRLENIPFIAGAHHEKLDGTGYPERLTAEELPAQVRIMTIADIFDALTANDRPYRKAASVERAVSILKEEAGLNKLDVHLVDLFIEEVIPSMLHVIPSLQR